MFISIYWIPVIVIIIILFIIKIFAPEDLWMIVFKGCFPMLFLFLAIVYTVYGIWYLFAHHIIQFK